MTGALVGTSSVSGRLVDCKATGIRAKGATGHRPLAASGGATGRFRPSCIRWLAGPCILAHGRTLASLRGVRRCCGRLARRGRSNRSVGNGSVGEAPSSLYSLAHRPGLGTAGPFALAFPVCSVAHPLHTRAERLAALSYWMSARTGRFRCFGRFRRTAGRCIFSTRTSPGLSTCFSFWAWPSLSGNPP